MPKTKDPEVLEFETALLRSVGQAVRGEYAAVRTSLPCCMAWMAMPARSQGTAAVTIRSMAGFSYSSCAVSTARSCGNRLCTPSTTLGSDDADT